MAAVASHSSLLIRGPILGGFSCSSSSNLGSSRHIVSFSPAKLVPRLRHATTPAQTADRGLCRAFEALAFANAKEGETGEVPVDTDNSADDDPEWPSPYAKKKRTRVATNRYKPRGPVQSTYTMSLAHRLLLNQVEERAAVLAEAIEDRPEVLYLQPVSWEAVEEIAEELRALHPGSINGIAKNNVKVLLGLGLREKHIVSMFSRSQLMFQPELRARLTEKFTAFLRYGFSEKEAVRALSTDSSILSHQLCRVVEVLEYLSRVVGAKKLGKVISQQTTLLRHSLANLHEKVDFLLSIGVLNVGGAVDRCPRLLSYHVTKLVTGAENLRELTGLTDVGHLVQSCPHNLGMCVDTVRGCFDGLTGIYGRDATIALVLRDPAVLQRTWPTISKKLAYIVHEMGRDPEEVLRWPRVVTYSLENVIEPRHRALASLGILDAPLSTICCYKDEDFEQRFSVVLPKKMKRRQKTAWEYLHESQEQKQQEARKAKKESKASKEELEEQLEEQGEGEEEEVEGEEEVEEEERKHASKSLL